MVTMLEYAVPDDDLHEAAVCPALATIWLGRPYYYVPEIDSTNDQVKLWVAEGTVVRPGHGTILLTDHQTAGRGRLGRRWECPAGSALLFSTLLRPQWPAKRASWLTMFAGLAMAEAIEECTGVAVGLKWPNDLMVSVNGDWCKLGGLLLDVQVDNGRLAHAILGIGLNVNITAEGLPEAATTATSLQVAAGKFVPRRPLLLACLRQLEQHYMRAHSGESPQPEWNRRLLTIGQYVIVSALGGEPVLAGMAEGTDEIGRLMVRDDAGMIHSVVAGDVTLRRPQVHV